MQEQNANEATVVVARSMGEAQVEDSPCLPGRSEDAAGLYLQHRKLLQYLGCRRFRIPDSDVESLIQEVFLAFLQTGAQIENAQGWLVGAMCNASRHYWKLQGKVEPLPDDVLDRSDPRSHDLAERLALEMSVHQALQYLQPRCRETLWLHYFEGRSSSDVAQEFETTTRYAEKLIHICLKRVREIYRSINEKKRT